MKHEIMRNKRTQLMAIVLALCLGLSACQTLAASQAASVDLNNPATRSAVTAVLADAVGRARIQLGPTGGRKTSVITVLPPPPGPLETNSTAIPIRFDIEQRGEACFAVRQDTGQAYELTGVVCTPL
jgi:hypothetical protein